MRILSLEIEGFMGFRGRVHLDLASRGLVHVAGLNLDDPGSNSNGSAKTTILEALTWCIFGEGLPRRQGNHEKGVQADEVCNDKTGKQTRVTTWLDDNGSEIGIVRWRKWKEGKAKRSNGVTVTVDGQHDTYLDMSEGNKRIRELLGIDRDIWCRAVVYGQESLFNFCESTAKERQDILTTVMGLEGLDRWQGRARDERKGVKEGIARAEGQIAEVAAQISQLHQENPRAQAEAWETGRLRELEVANVHLKEIEDSGQQLRQLLEEFQPEALGEEPRPYYPDSKVEEAWQAANTAGNDAIGSHRVAAAKLTFKMEVLGNLMDMKVGECPACHQPITEQHRAACIQVAELEVSQAREEEEAQQLLAQQATARTLEAHQLYKQEHQKHQAAHHASLEYSTRAKVDQQKRGKLEADIQVARNNWQRQKEQVTRITQEQNPYLTFASSWEERLKTAELKEHELKENLTGLQSHLAILNWWDTEIPRLKTWVFDSIVDTLAAETNRWLQVMTGGVVWIQVFTQVQRGKVLKDEVDIQIFRWNPDQTITSRPYRVWSGGEKRRVALAVDLGLSRLMAGRASKAYRFLALDEIDRHLDAKGREGLRAVLEDLRQERETTLVVTHDPDFRASFDSEILVTKRNSVSTVKEIEHDQGETQAA